MAVTFKCLTSGQTVTFEAQVDIDSMKGHSGYEEVVAVVVEEPAKKSTKKAVDTPVTSSEE